MSSAPSKTIDELVRRVAREVSAGIASHPPADAFLRHRRGELSPPELAAFEEHLAWCRDCAAIARELPAFLDDLAPPFDPAEREADWQPLLERL